MREAVCIIGAAGMLGCELVRTCRERLPEAEIHAFDLPELDITDAAAADRALGTLSPCLVFNAAAYTDVDGCESHPDLARAVNVEGPHNLARSCRAYGSRLIHLSTDFIFDGRKRSPYLPDDEPHPLSVYGATKEQGERCVRNALPDHLIVRTSWLFGVRGRNFVKTILRLAEEREELQVVDDQIGCPTYAPDLAEALLELGSKTLSGTYHFCNAGSCSWHEFANEILRCAGKVTPVKPISTNQLKRPAVRPAYSVLDTASFEMATGITPRPWQEALRECLVALLQPSTPAESQ